MPISQSSSQTATGISNVMDTADGTTGSAAPTITTQVGGTDGTNLRVLKTDSVGRLVAAPVPDGVFSGSIAALNATVVASTGGCSTVVFNISGTWVATLSLQGTVDGTNYFAILGQIPVSIATNVIAANNQIIVPCGGFSSVRLIATAYTSGTATIVYDAAVGNNVQQVINFTASALQTTTRLNDGSGNAIASDNSQLLTQDTINVGSQYRSQSVTATAAEATGAASRLTNRKVLTITPTNGTVYWGTSNSVTTTTGTPIFANQMLTLAFTDNVPVYVISSSTTDCRIVEGS